MTILLEARKADASGPTDKDFQKRLEIYLDAVKVFTQAQINLEPGSITKPDNLPHDAYTTGEFGGEYPEIDLKRAESSSRKRTVAGRKRLLSSKQASG